MDIRWKKPKRLTIILIVAFIIVVGLVGVLIQCNKNKYSIHEYRDVTINTYVGAQSGDLRLLATPDGGSYAKPPIRYIAYTDIYELRIEWEGEVPVPVKNISGEPHEYEYIKVRKVDVFGEVKMGQEITIFAKPSIKILSISGKVRIIWGEPLSEQYEIIK